MTTTAATEPGMAVRPAGTPQLRHRRDRVNWLGTAILAVMSLTILIPMFFTIVTAFKTPEELADSAFSLPRSFAPTNFVEAWQLTNYPKTALTSAIITIGAVVLTLATHSMVAYAIARNMHRPFFKVIYWLFISALFIPFPVVMLPLVKQTAVFRLDNPLGLILIYAVYGLAFNVLLYTSFIKSIPEELEEAARIDGASRWKIFWQIIFPLLGPMNATVGIFTFLWAWNDFLMPLVILSDPTQQTLPLAQYVFQGQFNTNYTVAFASYTMAMLPVLIVYLFAQRWIISGVMRGSGK